MLKRTTFKERRKHERFKVSFPVYIQLSDGDVVKASACDISLGGIYVEYGAPADEGREFNMMFKVPFAHDFRAVYARGRVVRAVVIGNRHVYGIAFNFVSFEKNTEWVLDQYINLRQVKKG